MTTLNEFKTLRYSVPAEVQQELYSLFSSDPAAARQKIGKKLEKDWRMGEVIHCGGAARDPSIHNLFQIADVDSGVIRWVNAVLVTHVIPEC